MCMKAPMKIMGEQAKKGIDNFMEAFQDYEIETIVAELQLKPNPFQSKGALKVKMKRRKKEEK